MSDLSAVALPDSPELPAEILIVLLTLVAQAKAVGIMIANDSRALPTERERLKESEAELASVIAKHLLTAEELDDLDSAIADSLWTVRGIGGGENQAYIDRLEALREKLGLRLSGSSRGEE